MVELFTLNILMRQTTKHRAMTYQGLVCSSPSPLPRLVLHGQLPGDPATGTSTPLLVGEGSSRVVASFTSRGYSR